MYAATEEHDGEATCVADDNDTLEQDDGADTSEDEDEPQVTLRESYTHEKLCVMGFLRDDLGNDWRSVVRMYNQYWYPDNPKSVCKDALYSLYKKEAPKGDRDNAGILGTDNDSAWLTTQRTSQNNEATCVVEGSNTLEQGDATDTSEDEDVEEEQPAPRRLGALTVIIAAFAVIVT
ncbi:hypothetical protein BZA05DRAFT_416265 [Tricharina praecox]|uniref:uncharacterized protein n=1 Tax=Tricharina praecox TaxID=43433 RepID=UPI00221FCBE4|nr:uncharacterized protein BZA05DRAFT_416265 [Tricharina praecox]KAI5856612.1 hypothetical protein BZA05DRAFT_416265 [Tricharina praecox]